MYSSISTKSRNLQHESCEKQLDQATSEKKTSNGWLCATNMKKKIIQKTSKFDHEL
jgi:hypothetical protein